MKKFFILLTGLFLITGCQTQEEIRKQKEQEELNKIKEEVAQTEVPESTKEWLIKTKTENVLTILCITSSKKCSNLKTTIEEIQKEYKLTTFFINIDELTEEEKNIYKTTYELNDYTGYLPYIIVTKKDKYITSIKDTIDKKEILNILMKNKLINSDIDISTQNDENKKVSE